MRVEDYVRLCVNFAVDAAAIQRRTQNGRDEIVVRSYTLPDDVAMNGILYPASEIHQAAFTLEDTHAPIGHPLTSDGEILSATSPRAIPDYYAGVRNENVRRENGRLAVDKVIDIAEANRTPQGQRLLERIDQVEKGANDPINTSVGLMFKPIMLDAPRQNAAGEEYEIIASEIIIDHDAILLDEPPAATPERGVGMAINSKKIHQINYVEIDMQDKILEALSEAGVKTEGLSEDQLWTAFNALGHPSRPNPMQEAILNALKVAKVDTSKMDTGEIMTAYNALVSGPAIDGAAPKQSSTPSDDSNSAVLAAINNLGAEFKALQADFKELKDASAASAASEKAELVKFVVNSDKYKGILKDADAGALPVERLREMAAELRGSTGLPSGVVAINHGTSYEESEIPDFSQSSGGSK